MLIQPMRNCIYIPKCKGENPGSSPLRPQGAKAFIVLILSFWEEKELLSSTACTWIWSVAHAPPMECLASPTDGFPSGFHLITTVVMSAERKTGTFTIIKI